MKIYIIRHGQTGFNVKGIINGHLDDPLTPEGISQAEEAAKSIPETIKRIYSSSLARARQTAEILNKKLNAELTFHEELREVNFGDLNGTPFLEEYKKRHRTLDYDWRAKSGENVEDVKNRVLKILKIIRVQNHKDGEALIVAHGGIVRMLYFLQSGELLGETKNVALYEYDLDQIIANASKQTIS